MTKPGQFTTVDAAIAQAAADYDRRTAAEIARGKKRIIGEGHAPSLAEAFADEASAAAAAERGPYLRSLREWLLENFPTVH